MAIMTDGTIPLDSFSGGSDDSKLTAALAEQRNAKYKSTITYGPREHVISGNYAAITGTRFGPAFPQMVEQARGGDPYAGIIKYRGKGTMWALPAGNQFGLSLDGVFEGNGKGSFFIDSDSGGVFWVSAIKNACFTNWERVCGNKKKFLITMSTLFDGHCNINNGFGPAIWVGGSDSALFTGIRSNIDSPPANRPIDDNLAWHMILDGLQKSNVGDAYITAQKTWNGVKVMGDTGGLRLNGTLIEGKNAADPCTGLLLSHEGGRVKYRDVVTNHTTREAVRVSSGLAKLLGLESSLANVQSPDNPLVVVTGAGKVRVRDCDGLYGRWAGRLPVVRGIKEACNLDDSVRWAA